MKRITFLWCLLIVVSTTMSAQTSFSDTEAELQQAAAMQSTQSQSSIEDLVTRHANLGDQTGRISDHFTLDELKKLKSHFNLQNRNALADIIPTAGATETFAVVAGDNFFDPGGPGGGNTDGEPGNYPNCACVTLTTLTGVTEMAVNDFIVFATFDWLRVYDGVDTTGAVLYDNGAGGANAGDIQYADFLASNGSNMLIGTSGSMTFEFNATGVVDRLGWDMTVGAGGGPGGCPIVSDCNLSDSTPDDATSPDVWDRAFADGTCCSGGGPVSYDVYGPFTVDTSGPYDILSVQVGGWDGYLFVYENCFDPLDQTTGYVAGDDDGAGGIGTSDIIAAPLVTGTEYYIITTGFGAGDFGDFDNTITGPGAVTCGSPPPSGCPIASDCNLSDVTPDDATSPDVWDRAFADGTCCSGGGPVSYDVYGPFTVDTSGPYDILSVQVGGWDGYLFVYENCFDPLDQTMGYVAGDDDGAGGIGTSDIIAAPLVTGVEYYIITTGFGAGDFGPFDNTITGPGAVTCGSAPPGGPSIAYGYTAFPATPDYNSFDVAAPDVFTDISAGSGTTGFEPAGDVDPNNSGTAYAQESVAFDFYSVDIATGVYTLVGNNGMAFNGMAFDPVSGTLYAEDGASLYTVDTATGTATLVGATGVGGLSVDMAIDGAGVGYLHDIVTDEIYSVDLITGAATLLGATGFDANFAQGMTWDPNTDTVYLAAFNNGAFQGELRSVDTATGATTLIGPFDVPDLSEVTWMAIPEVTVPPTDNDLCADATPVVCGDTVLGDTSDNTDAGGANTSPDEWFQFTGTGAAEFVTISLCDGGTGYDSFLSVYDACGGTQVASNDDACGLQSELTFTSDGTSTYYIAVEGFGTNSGAFSLAVTCALVPPPPPNDECGNAIAVTCGDNVVGTTEDATIDDLVAPTCDTAVTSPGVWYVLDDTSGLASNITISMCNGATMYDSKLSVYTGDCAAPPVTCVVGNDDTCGLQSEVTFASDGNTTFLILVHGFGGQTGTFELDITCDLIPPPNDMIANSIDVDEIGFPYTDPAVAMPAATTEAGTPAGCDNAGVRGVWYNFVPEGNGSATASITSPAGASSVTFYSAPNESSVETDLTLVDYFLNQCVSGVEATITTTAGQAYYVYVANHDGITDIVIDGVNLGATDNTIEGFVFYPNPARDAINLNAADIIESVEVYSIIGQRVLNQTINATTSEINVSDLSAGTYLMKVTVNGEVGVYKVIKE